MIILEVEKDTIANTNVFLYIKQPHTVKYAVAYLEQ